jgi:hypothetical protein
MNVTRKFLLNVSLHLSLMAQSFLAYAMPQSVPSTPPAPTVVPVKQYAVNEWPRFLGSQIDGISLAPAPPQKLHRDWSKDRLPLLWQTDVGEGYAMGVVSGDRYYHFDKPKMPRGYEA